MLFVYVCRTCGLEYPFLEKTPEQKLRKCPICGGYLIRQGPERVPGDSSGSVHGHL